MDGKEWSPVLRSYYIQRIVSTFLVKKGKGKLMPLTKEGRKVMKSMIKQYGKKKARNVFYASINKGVKGSKRWHG